MLKIVDTKTNKERVVKNLRRKPQCSCGAKLYQLYSVSTECGFYYQGIGRGTVGFDTHSSKAFKRNIYNNKDIVVIDELWDGFDTEKYTFVCVNKSEHKNFGREIYDTIACPKCKKVYEYIEE